MASQLPWHLLAVALGMWTIHRSFWLISSANDMGPFDRAAIRWTAHQPFNIWATCVLDRMDKNHTHGHASFLEQFDYFDRNLYASFYFRIYFLTSPEAPFSRGRTPQETTIKLLEIVWGPSMRLFIQYLWLLGHTWWIWTIPRYLHSIPSIRHLD